MFRYRNIEAIDSYPYPEIINPLLSYLGHDALDVIDKMIECKPEKILKTLLELHPREFLTYMDAERSLTTICSDLSVAVGMDATASLLLYDRLLLQNYLTGSNPTETEAAMFAFCYSNLPLWDDIVFHSLSECEFKTCLKSKWVEMGLDSSMMLDYARTESWTNIVHKLYENGEDSLNYLFAYYYFGEMIELLENWHYPLIGFMNRVESYYGTETRDALDGDTLIAIQYLSLSEYHIYGSSRLGILKMDDTLKKADIFYRVWLSDMSRVEMSVTLEEANRYTHDSSHTLFRGRKMYEGVNHLGNVLVVYSDKRLNVCNADTVTYYRADLVQAADYSAFGVVMEEREWYVGMDSSVYRFGYNTQEAINEVKGVKNHYSALFWEYDPRIVTRWNRDPITYPWQSPYAINNSSPIIFSDPLGLFGSRKEARKYKKEHGLKGRIKKDDDGIFSISNKKDNTSYYKDPSLDDVPNVIGRQEDGVIKAVLTTADEASSSSSSGTNSKGGSSEKDIVIGITGTIVGGMELSYLNDAKQVYKYGQRIDGKVRSAETLTRANRINSTSTAKYLGYTGKVLGIYGAYDAGTNLLNDPSNPANWVKFGASTALLFMKANPYTLVISVGYTILDEGGYIDDWIGNKP